MEYINRFRWLICPKSVFLYCWFWSCRLDSSRHEIRLLILISYVFTPSGHVIECLFSATVEPEVRSNFSFVQGRFLFPDLRRPHFLSGVSGNFCTSWIYFIISFLIFHSIPQTQRMHLKMWCRIHWVNLEF